MFRITAYIFGELSDDERRAFEAEMEQSETLREAVAQQKQLIGILQQEFTQEPQPTLTAEQHKHISALAGGVGTEKTGWSKAPIIGGLVVVASVLFAVFLLPAVQNARKAARLGDIVGNHEKGRVLP